MLNDILFQLPAQFPWKSHIHHFPCVESTNTLAKSLAAQGAPNGTVLIADAQSGGRGRMGRSFHSPQGTGIYLSLILRPECPASALMHLTCATAVAVCSGLESACGMRPGIKWTNDLVWQSKKLGGILTELSIGASGMVDYAVVGIGINCLQQENDFPEDIRDIAASLSMATGKAVSRSTAASALLIALEQMSRQLLTHKEATMIDYRQDCITLGREISVSNANGVQYGTALDIDDDGALLVSFSDGRQEYVSAGEVSIRGMYGYI